MHTAARRGREEHWGGRPVREAELPALQEGALASLGAQDLRQHGTLLVGGRREVGRQVADEQLVGLALRHGIHEYRVRRDLGHGEEVLALGLGLGWGAG